MKFWRLTLGFGSLGALVGDEAPNAYKRKQV
jgi:hypothetical protein